jgi:hypothetical protein
VAYNIHNAIVPQTEEAAMEATIRQTIKGYELRERIGAGGFGAVY